MRSGGPWHVKGVRPDARSSAHDAARRAGMSVGDWLNSVILESSGDTRGQHAYHDPYAPPSYRAQHPAYDPMADQVAAITRQLEGLTQGFESLVRSSSASRSSWSEQDGTAKRLADALARLDQRLDTLAHEGRNASKALERRVESVDRALSSLGRARINSGNLSGMDQAMADIQQRQRELDADPYARHRPNAPAPRLQDDYSDVHERLRSISEQLEALGPDRMQSAVNALRNDLAEITRALTEASPRRAIEALEGEVRVLASRIDMRGGGGASVERGLAEVRDTLRALTPAENLAGVVEAIHAASRRIDQVASGAADPSAMQQLEGAIAGLREILSHVASRDALAALTEEVRALAARIDSAPSRDNDILRNLEGRIATIADAIESVRAAGHAGSPDLDAMVRTLGDKIERLHASGDQTGFAALEDRIGQLVRKIDASEARLGNLDAIERGMKELLGYLSDTRGGPKPDIIARDVRRAEQSLEAAHGTIGDVVDRLAMIETGIRSEGGAPPQQPARPATNTAASAYQTMPNVSSPPLQAAQPHVHAVAGAQQASHAAAARAAEPQRQQAARPAAAQARPAADGTLPYDFPLEPGSGKPRPGMAQPAQSVSVGGSVASVSSPAERIAKSKAALEPGRVARAAPVADESSKSNFIMAARRAAQFAAENQDGPLPPEIYAARAAATDEGKPTLMRRLVRMIKPVLIGLSVLVLLAAAIHTAVNLFAPGEPAPEAPKEAPSEPGKQSKIIPPNLLSRLAQYDFIPTSMLGGQTKSARPANAPAPAAPAIAPAIPAPPIEPVTIAGVLPPPTTFAPAPVPPVANVTAPPAPAMAAPHVPAPASPHPMTLAPPAAPRAAEPSAQNVVNLAPPEVTSSIGGRKLSPPPAALFPNPAPTRVAVLPTAIGASKLITAAEAGDAAAAYEIAIRYFDGRGVAVNTEEAAVWFERAGRKGLTQALFRLGGLYEKGTGVKKDLQRARSLYTEAADRGNAKAMHNLAVLYADGIDGKPDYTVAVRWFHKAAARGVADSQYNLGVLYARGIGMEQNLAESYKWFALAAATGDKDAGQKRDDVGKRLDAQTIAALQASVAKWSPEPQPEDAVAVHVPPGGWDQGAPAPAKPKAKRAQQTGGVKAL